MQMTGRNRKKILAFSMAAAMSICSFAGYAATSHWNDASGMPSATTKTDVSDSTDWNTWKQSWNTVKTDYEQVSLAPGSDFSKMNFGWYSAKKADAAVVRIAGSKDMDGAKTFQGTSENGTVINGVQYYTNKVTADGFKPNHTYWYQVKVDGKWLAPQEYKTGDPNNFSFMFAGDPQIGASIGQTPAEGAAKQDGDLAARNDAYNWNKTLNEAMTQHPEINFLVSAGDQVNEAALSGASDKIQLQEYQYAGYLSAAALRSLPEASTIGNHDSMTNGYQNHFNVPNPFTEEANPTAGGHGYYYTYGSALFIVINANNFNAADHKALIEKAIAAHPDTKWRVVVMHQDIYGTGYDHSDSDGIILRTQLTPIYDANHIDVVLQGHDHTYARTYQLSGDGKDHAAFRDLKGKGETGWTPNALEKRMGDPAFKDYYESQNICYTIADMNQGTLVNPKGVFYMTSNSATGSKFYNLIPQQQDYVAVRNQTWRPTYSVVNITKNSFKIMTYDAESGTPIDEAYTIVKE